jgi:hypothetical protein
MKFLKEPSRDPEVIKNSFFENPSYCLYRKIIISLTLQFIIHKTLTGKSGKTVGIKGKIIRSQAREIIASVLELLKKEATHGGVTIP